MPRPMPEPFTPERILLIQLRRIGDVLMTTPTVAALRKAYPGARISFLTEKPSDQLFRHNPNVDQVILHPRCGSLRSKIALLWRLRREKFDLVVDFFSNPRSALITRSTGAVRRIGLDFRGRRWGYTETVRPDGPVSYSAGHKAALVKGLGVAVPSLLPEIFLGETERAHARRQWTGLGVTPRDLLVALCPVSRRSYRAWPVERYAHLADVLIERYGAKVWIVWGPGEETFNNALRLHMRHLALPDFPMPDLLEMAALLERCHLFLGNDGGPHHMAVSVGTPTLTVFGRDFAHTWTPPDVPIHRSVEYDPGCKTDCHYPRCGEECLADLTYGAVEQALELFLETLLEDGHPRRTRH
ncbi:MAG: glycosyltransferase family 9 protein [SAR324 cluster bacterium]|nr:glycosyltransferase family 9 protein [SAR324 cluster bacterium]